MNFKAAVITDVIKSSTMTDEDRRALDGDLRKMFADFNLRFDHELTAVFDFSLGDEFQVVFAPADCAIKRVFLMHAYLASQLAQGKVRVRSSIGVGRVSVETSRIPREQDGPAFHLARRLISDVAHEKRSLGIACNGDSSIVQVANEAFEVGCNLLHAIMCEWTRAQWEVAFLKWDGKTIREMAELLQIQPQNVFKRLKSAHFSRVERAIEGFETILRQPMLQQAVLDADTPTDEDVSPQKG